MMNYTIREARAEDFEAMLGLIQELAAFENAAEQVLNTVEQMKAEQDCFQCFVVEVQEQETKVEVQEQETKVEAQEQETKAAKKKQEIVGMALYYFAYYTWVGKSLYLDDLYVKESYRGFGIGSALLERLFEVARKENCKRVRWQVLNWNAPAIALYKKCGATIDNEWSNCDFDAAGIQEFKIG